MDYFYFYLFLNSIIGKQSYKSIIFFVVVAQISLHVLYILNIFLIC